MTPQEFRAPVMDFTSFMRWLSIDPTRSSGQFDRCEAHRWFMKITVAHSPDSDDAFMFYGLASGKVPTDGIEFGHLLADIETLNRAAFEGGLRGQRRFV